MALDSSWQLGPPVHWGGSGAWAAPLVLNCTACEALITNLNEQARDICTSDQTPGARPLLMATPTDPKLTTHPDNPTATSVAFHPMTLACAEIVFYT